MFTAHCLFEQSGTFKNAFKSLGFPAFDYDLCNDFNETDFILDLFTEIDNCYNMLPSIFDDFDSNDLIFAFFPCTFFESQSFLNFSCNSYSFKSWSYVDKLAYSSSRFKAAAEYYDLFCKLFSICFRLGFKLIVENPSSNPNILKLCFPIPPSFTDFDRRDDGDYYKKPTNFWFVNFDPKSNLVFEPLFDIDSHSIESVSFPGISRKVARSLIHPQYALRFIKRYIL